MATLVTLPTTLPTHELLGFAPTDDLAHEVESIAQKWLTAFAVAAAKSDGPGFAKLFAEDGTCSFKAGEPYKAVRQLSADGLERMQASGATFWR